jgi:hypothetical protein
MSGWLKAFKIVEGEHVLELFQLEIGLFIRIHRNKT